ncbi:MAG: NAD(P)/FAD-dependent oxidoreductase [Chitinophagaceae bacterium]|nr:NAD(P)/FAD-dependent oxidoreductase [Rubrivivax sp.]
MKLDAIVVGGSYAGLSAALQLARARRRIAVFDAGQRRNRFADTSHGFLGQDGRASQAIIDEARAQLLAYPNVRWLSDTAETVEKQADDDFAVTTSSATLHAKRVVLATGVVDELPAIEGLAQRWGRSVFHCPYCHGYELNNGRIGVLASGPMAAHQAVMLTDWGSVTLFVNRAFEPDEAQMKSFAQRGVDVEVAPVVRLSGTAIVELADGRKLDMDGLFTVSATRMASPVAEQLGCAFDDGPTGPFIRRSESNETTVAGVFACGDAARMFGSVAISVGDGAMTGAFAHRSMIAGL